MKIQKFEKNDDWLEARRGRITGTRLGDLLSKRDKKPKIGYYELIAERIAIPASGENVMDRGLRLEDEAIARFAKDTGKEVNSDKVIWSRDDNDAIALSPDGSVVGEKAAVESKSLSSARHIEAYLTQQIPADYEHQKLQYFIVNEELETLYFLFYDPRMPIDFFYLTITRAQVQKEVDEYLEIERKVLAEVAEIERRLTF